MARHVVLVGLMAAGKTTVGRLLARELGVPFSDSDEAIGRERGTTVAAAASTIDDDACRAALTHPGVTVIWLKADPAVLAGRFDGQRHRPRFGRAPVTLLAEQAAERDPLFRALEPIVIEIERKNPSEVAAAALVALGTQR